MVAKELLDELDNTRLGLTILWAGTNFLVHETKLYMKSGLLSLL